MKTKKISKIYLIVFAILLALLCSFSIALTAFNNADAKETVALNLENDISETNDGYQNTKFILHGHTIYSY